MTESNFYSSTLHLSQLAFGGRLRSREPPLQQTCLDIGVELHRNWQADGFFLLNSNLTSKFPYGTLLSTDRYSGLYQVRHMSWIGVGRGSGDNEATLNPLIGIFQEFVALPFTVKYASLKLLFDVFDHLTTVGARGFSRFITML
jgi:hypothetical protein